MYRCPSHYVDDEVDHFLRTYVRYRSGILPRSGGWEEQDALWCRMVDLADSEYASIQDELERARRRKKG